MDFHPRPWGVVRKSSPSCPRHMRPHGRGAAVSARCASRDSRTIQRIGRDAGNCVAQTERGGFRSSSLGGKSAPLPEHRFATRYRSGDMRSVFRLRRASRPLHARHICTPVATAHGGSLRSATIIFDFFCSLSQALPFVSVVVRGKEDEG